MLATKGVASSPRVGCEDEAVVSAGLAPICVQGGGATPGDIFSSHPPSRQMFRRLSSPSVDLKLGLLFLCLARSPSSGEAVNVSLSVLWSTQSVKLGILLRIKMVDNPNRPCIGKVTIASSLETWFLAVQNWRGFQGCYRQPFGSVNRQLCSCFVKL